MTFIAVHFDWSFTCEQNDLNTDAQCRRSWRCNPQIWGQNWLDLGKITAKFGQNQNLASQKHSFSYGYADGTFTMMILSENLPNAIHDHDRCEDDTETHNS